MKTLFIPAKVNSEVNERKIEALKLPESIAILYSVQYQDIALKIKEILSKKSKITEIIQVLGCSKPKFSNETKAVLLISSGQFHAVSLARSTRLPIYILEADRLRKISNEEISAFEKRKQGSQMKFLNSENVGILVSVKPGQENMKKALSLKDKLKNKKSYLFLGNDLNSSEFENFNDIEAWINTACPRMDFDSSVINIEDLEKKN